MKKISLRSVSDFLSDNQMKRVVGGYDPDLDFPIHCFSNSKCNGSCSGTRTCKKDETFGVCMCED